MMIDPLDAAKYFIVRAYEENKDAEMTNMKLQKLLYYAQSLHLALHDAPLFKDEIQAWRYGPVCPPAYHFYSQYESAQLPIPSGNGFSGLSSDVKELLEEVWSYFGLHNAQALSNMTHLETPWKEARGDLPREAPSEEPLDMTEMRKLGKIKLAEIESGNPVYKPIMAAVLEGALSTNEAGYTIKQEEVRGWLESLLD